MRKTTATLAAIAGLLTIACASGPATRGDDLRGRRIVDVERPVVSTEYFASKQVLQLVREPEDDIAGFTLAIERDVPDDGPFPRERQYELPAAGVRVFFLLAGGKSRPFFSKEPSGLVRVRELGDTTILFLDLELKGTGADESHPLPPTVFYGDAKRMRVMGTFTVPRSDR